MESPFRASIVVPTYQEAQVILATLAELDRVFVGQNVEVIVVDDNSPDMTWKIAGDFRSQNIALRVIRRESDPGLSRSVVDAMASSNAPVLAVIDADGQHDATILPALIESIEHGAEVAVGTRSERFGGSYGDWSWSRRCISFLGACVARVATDVSLSDPMSGLFAVSRSRFESASDTLDPNGFKILLVLVGRGRPPAAIDEHGYVFSNRIAGETKFSTSVGLSFLAQSAKLLFSRRLVAEDRIA